LTGVGRERGNCATHWPANGVGAAADHAETEEVVEHVLGIWEVGKHVPAVRHATGEMLERVDVDVVIALGDLW
jgi:hypothetical protein